MLMVQVMLLANSKKIVFSLENENHVVFMLNDFLYKVPFNKRFMYHLRF